MLSICTSEIFGKVLRFTAIKKNTIPPNSELNHLTVAFRLGISTRLS